MNKLTSATCLTLGFLFVSASIYAYSAIDVSADLSMSSVVEIPDASATEDGLFPNNNNATERPVQENRSSETPYFTSYKPNYLLPLSITAPEIEGREDREIKYQISIQQALWNFRGFELVIAYTQESFWQAYNQEESSPFRETNYNPELFVRSPELNLWGGHWKSILGYEHESNGEKIPLSRSWDRLYLRLMCQYDWLYVDYKSWYRIPEKEKKSPDDPKGDDNPDIDAYYGFSELTMGVTLGDTVISFFGRANARSQKGAFRIDLSHPFPGNRVFGYLQYWSGYGESLIDYNQNLTRLGVGLMITRSRIY